MINTDVIADRKEAVVQSIKNRFSFIMSDLETIKVLAPDCKMDALVDFAFSVKCAAEFVRAEIEGLMNDK